MKTPQCLNRLADKYDAADSKGKKKMEMAAGIILAVLAVAVIISASAFFPDSRIASTAALFVAALLCAGVPSHLQKKTGEPMKVLNLSVVLVVAFGGALYFFKIYLTANGAW